MFEHADEKIKKVSIVLFWIVTVASVILAFVLGWQEVDYIAGTYFTYTETETVFMPYTFFGLLIGVPVASYISTLCLIAFSDLVHFARKVYQSAEKIELMQSREEEKAPQ